MIHETFRELLALRLYDELEAAESAALDAHLAGCAACRTFALELQAGLGRAPQGTAADDLPAGWSEALRARIGARPSAPRPATRRPALLAFASGLAAGLLVMAGWRARGEPSATPARPPAAVETAFARATPPPLASGRGPLAQLAALERRR